MSLVLIGRCSSAVTQLMGSWVERGQAITLAREPQAVPELTDVTAIVPLETGAPLAEVAAAARERGWAWLGWDCADSPALALAAYQAGARAVLPPALTPDVLRHALDALNDPAQTESNGHRRNGRREYHYRQGNVILPEPDTVVEVQEGIIAIGVVHSDGAQVLLGLCGPRQILVSHPHDT